MEGMGEMGCLVPVGLKDREESKEQQVPLAQGMEGWSTQGGEKEAAQMSMELSWCMQEGLEEAGMAKLEEVPTTSACLMIQTTLHTNVGCKGGAMCMEQSMKQGEHHSELFTNTMFPVLCVMLQQGWQLQ